MPKNSKKNQFSSNLKENIQKLEQNVENQVQQLEMKWKHFLEQISRRKIKIWHGFLVLTLLTFLIGISLSSIGTFSKHYRIQRIRFTTEISYNRAIANQDLLFNNVSILPDDLEILEVTGYLITPTHPKTTPMPGIVWSHGMVVNSEINLHNALDLAVAGFKVLAIDLPGHGANSGLWDFGLAELQVIWSGVEFLANQTDVDSEKIAVAGHSNGGMAVTRAGIFDNTPFGTGGKIKAVCALWTYSDLEDTLINAFGVDIIDDYGWGQIVSGFFGCKNGVITSADNDRRSIIDFINSTNIPNYYILTGGKDQLTNISIQFSVYETATAFQNSSSQLISLYESASTFDVNNTLDSTVSFTNGTARKISIRKDQDHITEVMKHENMQDIVNWFIPSLNLTASNHLMRTEYTNININFFYYARIIGGSFLIGGTILLIITCSYFFSEKFFPKNVACTPQFIPHSFQKQEQSEFQQKMVNICDDQGREFRVSYIDDPQKFINNWKKKFLFFGVLILCFLIGISISWRINRFYLNLWLMNIYIWQYFWVGLCMLIFCVLLYWRSVKHDSHVKKIELNHIGVSKSGFIFGLAYTILVLGIPLLVYNGLAAILKAPYIFPRPFSIQIYSQILLTFLMIFSFYYSLEFISKTQMFNQDYAFGSLKGYFQEIFVNGSVIWLMWLISYLIGGVFMNQKLLWLIFQGNTGSFFIIVIGTIMIVAQGIMAYISAFVYQQTHNITAVALIEAGIITLLMTGKFVFIYSVV